MKISYGQFLELMVEAKPDEEELHESVRYFHNLLLDKRIRPETLGALATLLQPSRLRREIPNPHKDDEEHFNKLSDLLKSVGLRGQLKKLADRVRAHHKKLEAERVPDEPPTRPKIVS